MKKDNPEISHGDAELNSVPLASNFASFLLNKEVTRKWRSQAQAALQPPLAELPPAPIGKPGNADPPKEVREEPAARSQLEPAQKIPLQMQDSAEPITDSVGNGKQVRKSGTRKLVLPPVPCELTDALAERVIEVLPAIEQQLLEEGVISQPILPEEVVLPKTIGCEVELRLGLNSEPKGPPSSAHFDSDPSGRFCRLLRIWLNICNPAMRACLKKRNVGGVRFFAAVALVRCLSRDSSPLAQALLAEIKMGIGLAPNRQITPTAFARHLASSPILEALEEVCGEAFENSTNRSFVLAQIAVGVPVAELGPPWDKN
jgi:hypothetical protein